MRLLLLVALLGVIAVMCLRGRERNNPAIALLTLVALCMGTLEGQWLYREHLYTQATRDLSGRDDVKAHCQRTLSNLVDISGNLGYVPYPPDGSEPTDAYYRKDTCEHLAAYLGDKTDPTPEEIRAVHVLTHEAMHLTGERDESMAECKAIQRNYDTALALGATKFQATQLATDYYLHVYPKSAPEYIDPECKPGGTLDEHLPVPPWGEQ